MNFQNNPVPTTSRTLRNGLRVRVASLDSVPAVGVALHCGVGFRSDPAEFPGLAHLFEHLMFQGGQSGDDHFARFEALGGYCNASTRQDYTDFYSVVPKDFLAGVLALEAERMREPHITEQGIRIQRAVVREEIMTKSRRPYGRFPWPLISPLLFDAFANSHDGYGDPAALENVTLDDCAAFFDRHYTPSNTVLTITGGIDSDQAADLADQYFGEIPNRPGSSLSPPRESGRDQSVTAVYDDPYAPLPAVALGYRAPDPVTEPEAHFGMAILAEILTGGTESRLERRLRRETGQSITPSARSGLFDFMDARDPDLWLFTAIHPEETDSGHLLEILDSELHELAEDGPEETEFVRARARRVISHLRKVDRLAERTRMVGRGEALFADGDLPETLHRGFAGATREQVAVAAKRLNGDRRAILRVTPTRRGDR